MRRTRAIPGVSLLDTHPHFIVVVPSSCWIWIANTTHDGYGMVAIGKSKAYTHVFEFEKHRGPKPKGLELDHLCRNRACCNPEHLEPITHRENILRGNTLPAMLAKKTHCLRGHPFSGSNLRVNKTGSRTCIACCRIRDKARVRTR